MRTLACLVVLSMFGPCGDGLQRAIELVRAGDARGALAAADSDQDVVSRAQARVYVLHAAGDLEGALVAARSGSDAHPQDAWLAQRWADVALTLRRAGSARAAVERLEHAVASANEAERARFADALRSARSELEDLVRVDQGRDRAERRARAVAASAAAAALVALCLLAFVPRRRDETAPSEREDETG